MDITQARTVMRNGSIEFQRLLKGEAAGTITGKNLNTQLAALQDKISKANDVIALHSKALKLGGGDGTPGEPGMPLGLADQDIQAMHDAILHRKSYRSTPQLPAGVQTKAPGSIGGLLQPDLQPEILQARHEQNRAMAWFPAVTTGAPAVEYVRHNTTTGTAATVAEGAIKPNVDLSFDKITLQMRKLAVTTTVVDESLHDFATLQSYIQSELNRLIFDAENAQIINGDGTGQNLTGILAAASNVPTGAKAAGDTNLDAVEKALTILRTGPAKTAANALFMSPGTFSILRRSKDGYGRYLLEADPRADQIQSIWGIPVSLHTTMADGTILVANTGLLAAIWIHEGISVQMDASGDRFANNTTMFRVEERFGIGVLYPAAGYILTGIAAA